MRKFIFATIAIFVALIFMTPSHAADFQLAKLAAGKFDANAVRDDRVAQMNKIAANMPAEMNFTFDVTVFDEDGGHPRNLGIDRWRSRGKRKNHLVQLWITWNHIKRNTTDAQWHNKAITDFIAGAIKVARKKDSRSPKIDYRVVSSDPDVIRWMADLMQWVIQDWDRCKLVDNRELLSGLGTYVGPLFRGEEVPWMVVTSGGTQVRKTVQIGKVSAAARPGRTDYQDMMTSL